MRNLFLSIRSPIGIGVPGGVERGAKYLLCVVRESTDGRRQIAERFVWHYMTTRPR